MQQVLSASGIKFSSAPSNGEGEEDGEEDEEMEDASEDEVGENGEPLTEEGKVSRQQALAEFVKAITGGKLVSGWFEEGIADSRF